MEEKVEKKIKELPTLQEKVQAIAINTYLIEKRRLDKELQAEQEVIERKFRDCLLYTSPSPRDQRGSRMPSSA